MSHVLSRKYVGNSASHSLKLPKNFRNLIIVISLCFYAVGTTARPFDIYPCHQRPGAFQNQILQSNFGHIIQWPYLSTTFEIKLRSWVDDCGDEIIGTTMTFSSKLPIAGANLQARRQSQLRMCRSGHIRSQDAGEVL
jgi:hypothetical protein